jgi:hypothetical protein
MSFGAPLTQPRLAYIAQGSLHLQGSEGAPRVVESAFGRSLRQRAAEIRNRQAWKTQGFGAQFMGRGRQGAPEPAADEMFIALTSVARGSVPGEVFYSLETAEISGVFAVDSEGIERRLFHTADIRVRDLAIHPDGSAIAASVTHDGVGANIAALDGNGANLREVSEGDSLDRAPHWVPGQRRRLVFQSAGLGRDSSGRWSGRSPFTIQQLDLESGELICLADDPDSDFLGPQVTPDGSLYYIRRPFRKPASGAKPIDALKDTLAMPFQVAFGILGFLSLFAAFYGRKRPNWTVQGQNERGPEQIKVWDEMIPVGRSAGEERRGEGDAPSLVPSSWELIRQSSAGKEVLANGTLSFDIGPDGSILYSNGWTVHRIGPDSLRSERVFSGEMIEQVAAL